MNVIGLCQGANLDIFAEVLRLTADQMRYGNVGVFIADAAHAKRSPAVRVLEQRFDPRWLREWESVKAGLAAPADMDIIKEFEAIVGGPSLWSGILADRRLIFGRYCKSVQSYRPRYSHQQLLGILSEAARRTLDLFDRVKPDLIFGFVPVTLHEYLILRLAEARGVPVRLLRSTKIGNYISLNDRLFGLSGHIQQRLDDPAASKSPEALAVADRYLEATRSTGAVYEGMHLPSHALRRFELAGTMRALAGAARNEMRRMRDPTVREDNHNPGYIVPALLERVVQPMRAASARSIIRSTNEQGRRLRGSYCLFPLHFEPEIALQIYGRPLQNQIEVARTVALALPAGMTLVVKEHPRAAGFRPKGYYRKLLEIPNVVLAEAERPSRDLVAAADLVAVITGNIGLEAVVMGKPVIVLGQAEYSSLPSHLLRTCHNLYQLSAEIADLMRFHRPDHDTVRNYVAALVAGSVGVDLYSTLLGKGGRVSTPGGTAEADLQKLKSYALSRFMLAEQARQES